MLIEHCTDVNKGRPTPLLNSGRKVLSYSIRIQRRKLNYDFIYINMYIFTLVKRTF